MQCCCVQYTAAPPRTLLRNTRQRCEQFGAARSARSPLGLDEISPLAGLARRRLSVRTRIYRSHHDRTSYTTVDVRRASAGNADKGDSARENKGSLAKHRGKAGAVSLSDRPRDKSRSLGRAAHRVSAETAAPKRSQFAPALLVLRETSRVHCDGLQNPAASAVRSGGVDGETRRDSDRFGELGPAVERLEAKACLFAERAATGAASRETRSGGVGIPQKPPPQSRTRSGVENASFPFASPPSCWARKTMRRLES
ncbi:hypothetical protein MRX96_011617 [Rhipicephalus microplus]